MDIPSGGHEFMDMRMSAGSLSIWWRKTCRPIATTPPGSSSRRKLRGSPGDDAQRHGRPEDRPDSEFELEVLEYFVHEPPPPRRRWTPVISPNDREEHVADKQEYRYFQPIRLRRIASSATRRLASMWCLGGAGLAEPQRRRSKAS